MNTFNHTSGEADMNKLLNTFMRAAPERPHDGHHRHGLTGEADHEQLPEHPQIDFVVGDHTMMTITLMVSLAKPF